MGTSVAAEAPLGQPWCRAVPPFACGRRLPLLSTLGSGSAVRRLCPPAGRRRSPTCLPVMSVVAAGLASSRVRLTAIITASGSRARRAKWDPSAIRVPASWRWGSGSNGIKSSFQREAPVQLTEIIGLMQKTYV